MADAKDKELSKVEKSKQAALARIQRMKDRQQTITGGLYGGIAAGGAGRMYGSRTAEVELGERDVALFKLGKTEVDGTMAGGVAALAGAAGILGDDTYDMALYGAGCGLIGAHQFQEGKTKRLSEPPE